MAYDILCGTFFVRQVTPS